MSSIYSTDFDIIQYINRKIKEEINNISQLHEAKFSQLQNDTINIISQYENRLTNIISQYENRLNLLQQEILTINANLHALHLIISQQQIRSDEVSMGLSEIMGDESYNPEDDLNTNTSTEIPTQIINIEEMKQEESLPV